MTVLDLPSGGAVRLTGPALAPAVVMANGGSPKQRPGDWSATLEWLVSRLAPGFAGLRFAEVRYRIKSSRRLDSCTTDAMEAVAVVTSRGAREVALVGFSLGGAIAIAIADHAAVSTVIGLAPWIPHRTDGSTLAGRRLVVLHGRLDARLPGVPGVSAAHTRGGFERISRFAAEASYATIAGGVHGVAVRGPGGKLVPLPRAGRWRNLVASELARFEATAGSRLARRGRVAAGRDGAGGMS